jgi:hypothetical protein
MLKKFDEFLAHDWNAGFYFKKRYIDEASNQRAYKARYNRVGLKSTPLNANQITPNKTNTRIIVI